MQMRECHAKTLVNLYARQCRKLLHDGLRHAGVPGIIRMKTIGVWLVEHLGTSIIDWEETGKGVEVDDRYCPDIAYFLNCLHVFIEEDATYVLVHLVRLDVLVAASEVGTVDWCHDDDLLGRIHLLQLRHGNVDATFQGILVHTEVTVESRRVPG